MMKIALIFAKFSLSFELVRIKKLFSTVLNDFPNISTFTKQIRTKNADFPTSFIEFNHWMQIKVTTL